MQRILILVLFICGFVSAAFLDIDLKDSRLQTENYVYRPGGILGFAAEFGVFNEPKNMVDYTLAVGVSRFGYSHSDGDVSVSAWDFYVKPLVWSVTIKQIMFETYVGFGYVFSMNNFNPALIDDMEEDEEERSLWNDYSAEQPELFNSTELKVQEAMNRHYCNCL